jgi:acyl-CoA thioester hydrolase
MVEARRTATVSFAIPFADVDAMQIVWHGNYLKYFDLARDRLYCDAGLDLYQVARDSGVVFPITRTQTKHIRPLRFRDQVECTATLIEAECRLVLEFEIRLAGSGQLCAKGRTEQAAVRHVDQALELRIPEAIRSALRPPGTAHDDGR